MITRETDYAIRLLRGLTDQEIHTTAELTESEMVPHAFAYKILKKLSGAGYVQILRGAEGGYRLAVDLDDVTLYDLMIVMGDSCAITHCMNGGYECPWRKQHQDCVVHRRLAGIQSVVNQGLKAYTLKGLLGEADREGETVPSG
ncbi:MAG: Rrf2 family transcriptional regulator [Clostridiales bacterium]|nr:Rrf2 family transcriptional regulator [Clostridiales bacterium]